MLERTAAGASRPTASATASGPRIFAWTHGLAIDGNTVERTAENGVMAWRSQKGDDGHDHPGQPHPRHAGRGRRHRTIRQRHRAVPGGRRRCRGERRPPAQPSRPCATYGGGNVTSRATNVAGCASGALRRIRVRRPDLHRKHRRRRVIGIVSTNFADHGGRDGGHLGKPRAEHPRRPACRRRIGGWRRRIMVEATPPSRATWWTAPARRAPARWANRCAT